MRHHHYLLLALLLSGCAAQQNSALQCTQVSCRPQSAPHQLVIWWQPDLRNSAADFTRVTVND